jgi:hypothetical protein
MADISSTKPKPAQVVGFPPNSEERARRLRVEVERLARLPTDEWRGWSA